MTTLQKIEIPIPTGENALENKVFALQVQTLIVQPYLQRAQHVCDQINHIFQVARTGTDKTIAGQLNANLVDDLAGTWVAMQMYAGSLPGEEMPKGMGEMESLITNVCTGLKKLYLDGDSSWLRSMAREYEVSFNMPSLPQPPGRKAGKKGLHALTEFAGKWGLELFEQGHTYLECAHKMIEVINEKPIEKRTYEEERLLLELKGKTYTGLKEAVRTWVKRYKKEIGGGK